MAKQVIKSKTNNFIKEIKLIRDDKKYRENSSLCFIEGERIVFDTPKDLINHLIISEDYNNKKLDLYDDEIKTYVDTNVFNSIKDTKNSQGIIALVKTDTKKEIDFNDDKYVILDDINDPGNLGTILRVSEAMGIKNIIVSSGTCDVYNTKTLRSCMSSIFRINIYKSDNLTDTINCFKNNGFIVYGTILNNSKNYLDYDYNKKLVIIFGNEANGINENLYDLIDEKIRINMEGEIESLNVAVAYSIIASEIKRQKDINK